MNEFESVNQLSACVSGGDGGAQNVVTLNDRLKEIKNRLEEILKFSHTIDDKLFIPYPVAGGSGQCDAIKSSNEPSSEEYIRKIIDLSADIREILTRVNDKL